MNLNTRVRGALTMDGKGTAAAELLAEKHAGHSRPDVTGQSVPFETRAAETGAWIMFALQGSVSADLKQAALLCDMIDDGGMTKAEIEAQFGSGVADLVESVSLPDTGPLKNTPRTGRTFPPGLITHDTARIAAFTDPDQAVLFLGRTMAMFDSKRWRNRHAWIPSDNSDMKAHAEAVIAAAAAQFPASVPVLTMVALFQQTIAKAEAEGMFD